MMRPAPVALRVQGGGGLSPVGEPAHVPGRTVQMSQTRIAAMIYEVRLTYAELQD